MESERIVKNNEIEIEEVNVYTDDCGTTRKACVTDCIGGSALITPMLIKNPMERELLFIRYFL